MHYTYHHIDIDIEELEISTAVYGLGKTLLFFSDGDILGSDWRGCVLDDAARKLQSNECPYDIFMDDYNCGSHGGSFSTCLVLKKWVFSRSREESLCADPRALHYIYNQVRSRWPVEVTTGSGQDQVRWVTARWSHIWVRSQLR